LSVAAAFPAEAGLARPPREAAAGGVSGPALRRAQASLIANGSIAFATFLGGFVIFEPAPYELMLCAMLVIWALFGMRVPRTVLPLLLLLTVFCAGGIISSWQIPEWDRGFMYVAVSYFLALTSVFFAILIREDMGRLRLIFRAYVVAATITSALGIIGYFGVAGFEMFTRYSRAMGAFQDPNVYGPFLAMPVLYLIYGIVNRGKALMPLRIAMLLVILLGLFLAFSRAAWGLAVVTAAVFYFLLIVNEQRARTRLKYIVLAVLGAACVVVLIAGALQAPAISKLFEERTKVVQEYDGGRQGRFARHYEGFILSTEKPLGIGPLAFGFIFTEDTHNMYLKALMDYGWTGFLAWMTMISWTLIGGFKSLFRQRPWLPYFQIAYVVFLGHLLIGMVIDTDKWRHFYLSIGIVWGCMALERQWQAAHRPGPLARTQG
jgi:O-antigen ligase